VELGTAGRARRTWTRSFCRIIPLFVILSAALIGGRLVSVQGSAIPPGGLPSWNPSVPCTALLTTIEGVVGNQSNANGGGSFGGGKVQPGVPDKRSTSPPCTVNGNATFVEIHRVQMLTLSYTVEDCAQYPNGNFCDTTFNVQDPNCTSPDVYMCRLHLEIDQAWKSSGIAPGEPPVTTQLFDVQGFVYWDAEGVGGDWHSFSGWELHPLSAWRLSNSTTADFSITSNPGRFAVPQGSSPSGTIIVNSLDGFGGTVNMSATVDAAVANNVSLSLSAMTVSILPGGFASVVLAVQVSLSTPTGYWTIFVKGMSGSVAHTLLITLRVTPAPPNFSIFSTSPAATPVGSSATSAITVTGLSGFAGNVSLFDSPLPQGLTCGPISPGSLSLPPSPASASLSCNSSRAGIYTLTIAGFSGPLNHTTTSMFTFTDFSISASPTSMTVATGSSGTSTISLSSLYGFTGSVSLTATVAPMDISSSLSPAYPTASLNPASVNLPASGTGASTLIVSASLLTIPGTYKVTVTAHSQTLTHSTTVIVTVPLPLLTTIGFTLNHFLF